MKEKNNQLSRRELLKRAVGVSAGLIAAPMLNLGRFQIFARIYRESSAAILSGF